VCFGKNAFVGAILFVSNIKDEASEINAYSCFPKGFLIPKARMVFIPYGLYRKNMRQK
jgi:hypothetical protein